jgi:sphingomyelin phosphodiesterase
MVKYDCPHCVTRGHLLIVCIYFQMLCNNFVSGSCPLPPVSPLDLTGWFKTPKPANAIAPVPKGTNKLKVLHLSDVHLDPRKSYRVVAPCAPISISPYRPGYVTGSESNCTSGLCCRHIAFNSLSPQKPLAPAPRYGAYHWYETLFP